ncbi:MAG: hypothetical protein ACQESG_06350 [Nanobdellota archaeon]
MHSMSMFDSKKDKNENLEDTIKIMSTNLEVINQKLAMSSPSGTSSGPSNTDGLDEIDKKLNNLANIFKSGMDNVTQQISYSQNKFQILANLIQQSNEKLRKDMKDQAEKDSEKLKKAFDARISTFEENMKKSVQTLSQKADKNNATTLEIKEQVTGLQKEFNSVLKSMESMSSSKKGSVPPSFTKDLTDIKEKLGDKFEQTLKLLWQLLEINYRLVNQQKNNNQQPNDTGKTKKK